MRWLLINRCVDADPEADLSPHPIVIQPCTLLVSLLLFIVPLLLLVVLLHGVLSSIRGFL
jgi:hypothetical protein